MKSESPAPSLQNTTPLDLEVVFHPVEAQYGFSGLTFDPSQHQLLHSDWAATVARESHEPNFFVYHHKIAGSFVACIWLIRPGVEGPGLFVEVEIMNGNPNWFTREGASNRPSLQYMVRRLKARPDPHSMSKIIRNKLEKAKQAEFEESLQRRDHAKRISRMLPVHWNDHPVITQIRNGEMPFAWTERTPETIKAMSEGLR